MSKFLHMGACDYKNLLTALGNSEENAEKMMIEYYENTFKLVVQDLEAKIKILADALKEIGAGPDVNAVQPSVFLFPIRARDALKEAGFE